MYYPSLSLQSFGDWAVIQKEKTLFLSQEPHPQLSERTIYVSGAGRVSGIRSVGNFAERAIWLSGEFDWTLGYDNHGELIAVPTIKKETQ